MRRVKQGEWQAAKIVGQADVKFGQGPGGGGSELSATGQWAVGSRYQQQAWLGDIPQVVLNVF